MTSLFPKTLRMLVSAYIEDTPVGGSFTARDCYCYCLTRTKYTRRTIAFSEYLRGLSNIKVTKGCPYTFTRLS